MNLHNRGSPILPVSEKISSKNIQQVAENYWGKEGSYELWKISKNGKIRNIIVITSGDADEVGKERTFYHDQNFYIIGSGMLMKAFKFDDLTKVAKTYKVRSLYTYK